MNKEFEVNGVQYMAVDLRGFHEDCDTYIADERHILIYRHDSLATWQEIPAGTWEIVGLVRELTLKDVDSILQDTDTALIDNLSLNSLIIKKI